MPSCFRRATEERKWGSCGGRPAHLPSSSLGALILGVALASAQTLPLDYRAIGYASVPLSDPVTELSRKVETGKVRLAFDPATGYLPGLRGSLWTGSPLEGAAPR
jgi:hypothetical protein